MTRARRAPVTRSKRPADERKRDTTRRKLLERALRLFEQRGIEATTMRDIARAADLSLGAAYYYFPSKDALIFGFYEANQAEIGALAATATGDPRARLGAIMHGRLASLGPLRPILASIVQRLIDPHDALSAFSAPTRAVRDRAIAMFRAALDDTLPGPAAEVAASTLWLMHLAILLVLVSDASTGQARTHRLVDDSLDLVVPLLPLLGTPVGRAACERVVASLARAGIRLGVGTLS